jgi:RND family efflux transporter MFP subunit
MTKRGFTVTRIALLTLVLGAALVGAGCSAATSDAPERAAAAPITVTVDRVVETEVPSYAEAGGVVRARATALVASRVMAPIVTVTVKAGDRVRRGATLITLDARELSARQAGAAAGVTAAVESARAAESETAAAEAQLKLARATHARIRDLHAARSATAQELDQATAALEGAEAQVATARARTVAAGAARDAARAAADTAAIGAGYAVLTAPFDGIVTERHADPGSMAVPGTPLLVLEDAGAVRLEVDVDDTRAAGLRIGQRVDVRIDGDGSPWQPGTVAEFGRSDPASHSFVVKVDLSAGVTARPGTFGRARLFQRTRRALTADSRSIVRRGQLTFVFVTAPDGQAHLRPVVLGGEADGRTEILAGVTASETVVISPAPALTDGARVTGRAVTGADR